MNRHLNNLHRLAKELEVRYGNDDLLVATVKKDIDKFQSQQAMYIVESIEANVTSDGKNHSDAKLAMSK